MTRGQRARLCAEEIFGKNVQVGMPYFLNEELKSKWLKARTIQHENKLTEATLIIHKYIETKPLPDDLFTHQLAWRYAIVQSKTFAHELGDYDNKSYWEHELKAFDRTWAELERARS